MELLLSLGLSRVLTWPESRRLKSQPLKNACYRLPRIRENICLVDKRCPTLAKDHSPIDQYGVSGRAMTHGDQLMNGVHARHQFCCIQRPNNDIGSLAGFETT